MRPALLALALATVLSSGSAAAGDAVVVVQERRTPEAARPPGHAARPPVVRHVAILKNAGRESIRRLRVTVELQDYFGQVLWARAAVPVPSSLAPGETATLSLTTPDLDAHRKTRYRFEYRPDPDRRQR
jgi:hypothetical protein